MTVEQLLKPKYKVIADYPLSPYKVGDLMKQNGSTSFFITSHKAYVDGTPIDVEDNVFEATLAKYPHLFRKLEWWEGRKPEEMPEYLKDESGEVWRVYEYSAMGSSHVMLHKNFHDYNAAYGSHSLYELTPATETEYNEYLKTLNP